MASLSRYLQAFLPMLLRSRLLILYIPFSSRKIIYLKANGEETQGKPLGLPYKEWAPSVELLQQSIDRIIHAKTHGRATVNLQTYSK